MHANRRPRTLSGGLWTAALVGSMVLGLVWTGQALAQPGEVATSAVVPPQEEPDNYLRTPAAISDLAFSLQDREGWRISGITLGISNEQLVVTNFWSEPPNYAAGAVDKSTFTEAIISDTTRLPVPAYRTVAGQVYEVKAFTFGRAADGSGYVDWAHLVGPDGRSHVTFYEPPSSEPGEKRLCEGTPIFACLDICIGDCKIVKKDPCVCGGFGGCLVCFDMPVCAPTLTEG